MTDIRIGTEVRAVDRSGDAATADTAAAKAFRELGLQQFGAIVHAGSARWSSWTWTAAACWDGEHADG